MKVTLDRKSLIDALKTVKPTVGKRAALPALSGVLLDHQDGNLTVTSTDLTTTTTATVPAVFGDDTDQVLVWFDTFDSAVKAVVTDDVTLESSEDSLSVGSGSVKVMDPHEFPIPGGPKVTDEVVFDPAQWGPVLLASGKDDYRPIFLSVQVSDAGVVATDSYRLHRHTGTGQEWPRPVESKDLLLPDHLVATLVKHSKNPHRVKVGVGSGWVAVETDDGTRRVTRPMEGQYPNTERLWPNESNYRISVDQGALLEALKPFKTRHGDGSVSLTATATDLYLWRVEDGQTLIRRVKAAVEGVDDAPEGVFLAAFKAFRLIDQVSAAGDGTVRLEGRDNLKPWVGHGSSGVDTLLMPYKLDQKPDAFPGTADVPATERPKTRQKAKRATAVELRSMLEAAVAHLPSNSEVVAQARALLDR